METRAEKGVYGAGIVVVRAINYLACRLLVLSVAAVMLSSSDPPRKSHFGLLATKRPAQTNLPRKDDIFLFFSRS